MTITAPITVSTIGEAIRGPGLILQTAADSTGIEFRTGGDTLNPGGAGTYRNEIADRHVAQANPNSGTGLSVGDPADPAHNGDWFTGRNLYLTRWQTAIHLHSMGMAWLQNVVINNPSDAPGDFGVRVTGGSSNSHFYQGFTAGNVGIALSFETPGQGNVVIGGDMASVGTAYDLYSGVQMTVIGGNNEASTTLPFNVRANALLLAVGNGGQGVRTTPSFNLNEYGKLIRVGAGGGVEAGVVQVTGDGFHGNQVSLSPALEADSQWNDAGVKWKALPWPHFFSSSIPDPNNTDPATGPVVGPNTVIGIIGLDGHRWGAVQKTWNPYTSQWGWEWLNSGEFL